MLALIGLLAAFLTSLVCGLTALMAWLVTSTYVTIGKRTGLPGNLMVSFCVALPFLYGSLAISQGVSLNVGLFAAMAFLSNTGREINKGIVDVAGDKERNIQTIAVRFGNKVAAMLAALCYLSAVSLSVLPLVLNIVSWLFIPFIAVTDFGLILSSLMLLQSPSREKARKIKKVVLLFFLFGLFGFISGSL
jgi:geranylgeranylglycerol-phosphate geranylgeranyltransferase